ncbi:MAG: phosphotransferase [Chitinophagaceae bacterium]
MLQEGTIQKAAAQFGYGDPVISTLTEGLIHHTFRVGFTGSNASKPIVLQCINIATFSQPENIIHNYRLIYECIDSNKTVRIAPLVPTHEGKWFWRDGEGNFWRAIAFIDNSYTRLSAENPSEACKAAYCFAAFTRALTSIDPQQLAVIIPRFHDLAYRYEQFEEAISKATIQRLLKSTHVIAELRQRKKLVDLYLSFQTNPAFVTRLMHHDCKMSNVLLDTTNKEVICPVDLDTVMPGLFFSDLGDMIRSMAGTTDENSTRWEDIAIRKDYYDAIVAGYLSGMDNSFTNEEKAHIHYSGILMLFMQSLRFVTDFLNNDTYYKTTYPEQNLNRALNQLIMLEKLEEFVSGEYGYKL